MGSFFLLSYICFKTLFGFVPFGKCGKIGKKFINHDKEATRMAVKIKTQSGTIDISNDVISTVVGGAATDNYGVVGMASRNPLKDGFNKILQRDNYSKGVVVRQQDNGIAVEVIIIVGYGIKISEVSKSVQEKVKYNLETLLGITANAVNVNVQGVRVSED